MLVNISSVQGKIGTPLEGAYAASKHALEALSESLHFELGHFGIRVVIIEPGYIAPGMKHERRPPRTRRLRRPARAVGRHGGHADRARRGGRGPSWWRIAVADALEDPATPLRVEVGEDAAMVLRAAADAQRRRVRGHDARGARAHLVRRRCDVEKLMYLTWLEPGEHPGRGGRRDARSGGARSCSPSDPLRLTIDVLGSRERHPGAGADSRGRDAPARARLAVGRHGRLPRAVRAGARRPPRERLAGYSVVESLYRDYGGNQWSTPRDWPDGERSPGVLTVALLQQHPDQTFDEWMTRWHTRISPITEAIQPRTPLRPQRRVPGDHRRGPAARRASWRRRGPPSST